MIVYLARNTVNGKGYVGQTTHTLAYRRKCHKADAQRGSDLVFSRALRKYGMDAFEWSVLMMEENKGDLNESEQVCIKLLKTHVSEHGYNLAKGGNSCSGYHHTKETRRKMGEGNKGKVITKEAREQTSKTLKALWQDPEYRMRMKKRKRGKLTEEGRANIRKKAKERWLDPEYRAKIVKAQAGIPRGPYSPKRREAIRQGRLRYLQKQVQHEPIVPVLGN